MVDEDIIAGFEIMHEASKVKRASNRANSAHLLTIEGIPFESRNNGAHLIVDKRYDFWPGTGKWQERGQKHYRRGVSELIAHIRKGYSANKGTK